MPLLNHRHLVARRPFFVGDIFEQVNALMKEFDRPGPVGRGAAFSTSVFAKTHLVEAEDAYVLQVALPGVLGADVSVIAIDGGLKISAKRSLEVPDGHRALHLERTSSDLSRTFRFPKDIDASKVEASFDDGLLEVTIPHLDKPEARKVEIKSA